ncbi:hypothetical protein HYT23_01895 [Candidatus Pacearchaeota archaeon]|nr:hypothetical protein [Candidatus Pacearchaeota archaeon]
MDKKMNTKNLLVSFLAVVAVLALVATVSATELATVTNVKINDVSLFTAPGNPDQVIQAGDEIAVRVYFDALESDRDVTVTVTLDTGKEKAEASTSSFRVADGSSYTKGVVVKVPYELKDDPFDDVTLEVEIEGKDFDSSVEYAFVVERPQYAFEIKSVSTDQQLSAGETFPVEFVVKNIGYYDLDDTYVTVSIPELKVQKSGYFDDLLAMDGEDDNGDECDDDDQGCDDTVSGKLYLELPQDAKSGVYNLEVKVQNDDATLTKAMQVVVDNNFDSTVFKSGNSLWIVNPTNNVLGYRVVAESPASVTESIVFVPAGASTEVEVMPNAEGEYSFDVNVFSMSGDLVETVNFSGDGESSDSNDSDTTDPIVILTVILAIIFVVLLVVLIVLIGKKPEKSSEFGESYY